MSLIIQCSLALLTITFVLLIFQCLRSKSIFDQVLAMELMGVLGIALFLILFISGRTLLYLDLALLFTFISFVIALVFSTFLPKEEKNL